MANNQVFLILILVIFVLFVIWKLNYSCPENYSPYRGTGGCPFKTGYNYLDAYDQEDYYTKYPYIYPTPKSYITEWYKSRREENKFLEKNMK